MPQPILEGLASVFYSSARLGPSKRPSLVVSKLPAPSGAVTLRSDYNSTVHERYTDSFQFRSIATKLNGRHTANIFVQQVQQCGGDCVLLVAETQAACLLTAAQGTRQ